MAEKLEFKKLPWKSREDFIGASDETLERWRLQAIENDEFNKNVKKQMASKLKEANDLVTQIWGHRSKQVAYLAKARRDLPTCYNQLSIYNINIDYKTEQLEQRKKEEEQKKREEEISKKHDNEIRTLFKIATRHKLDECLGAYDLLYELLKKDKYLDLAYAMLQTRNDWTEGFHRVYSALNRFDVVNDVDEKIHADINECLEGGESDGRIFRDTEWSYSRIFELADNVLYEDLMTLYELTW